jgi:hypothetical protein
VKIFNFKAQIVALAIERDYAQAGSLRSSLANKLIEKGLVRFASPAHHAGLHLMATNRPSCRAEQAGAAAAGLKPRR